jgi:hypothetical protein
MPIPKSKEELIREIKETYEKLQKELVTIPIELSEKREIGGHTKNSLISINNLLAYLIGWGQLVLKWHDNKTKEIDCEFPEKGFKWNELGLLAQKFYTDFENYDYHVLQLKLTNTVNEFLRLIESKSNNELYEMPWYKSYTLGRMIQLNTSSPYKNARLKIRKWRNGHSK